MIEAEITAFGEALAAHGAVPGAHDTAATADYERALDAYERAKRDVVGGRTHARFGHGPVWPTVHCRGDRSVTPL
ncbi:hypothetical protein I5Q34_30285 [Streptomyces sp. AV19]|uniref:hypothetical protein n=1 Tax=Streptomyces sp. AV19 TaxID=2793068 RepID=UPI0018FE27D7|nr:hypothetical protein [Streptomyces sp. AV19]MBH1938497.1 hypothetical protein [Streptomyces sp. AV19]MDG4535146.1 hypothetical protein [Streptomyces sp. AV19]